MITQLIQAVMTITTRSKPSFFSSRQGTYWWDVYIQGGRFKYRRVQPATDATMVHFAHMNNQMKWKSTEKQINTPVSWSSAFCGAADSAFGRYNVSDIEHQSM